MQSRSAKSIQTRRVSPVTTRLKFLEVLRCLSKPRTSSVISTTYYHRSSPLWCKELRHDTGQNFYLLACSLCLMNVRDKLRRRSGKSGKSQPGIRQTKGATGCGHEEPEIRVCFRDLLQNSKARYDRVGERHATAHPRFPTQSPTGGSNSPASTLRPRRSMHRERIQGRLCAYWRVVR